MDFFKRAAKRVNEVAAALEKTLAEMPLFTAVSTGNLDALARAYAEGENLEVTDLDGNTILHIAIKVNIRAMVRAVLVLTADAQLWERTNDEGKKPIDFVSSPEIKKDLQQFTQKHEPKVTGVDWSVNLKLTEAKLEPENIELERVLFSLDGGGMRGVIELQIMLHLEARLGFPLMGAIDWIAGTSTGSIIALALAQGRSVRWTHRLYMGLGPKIFRKGEHVVPRYNAKYLEQSLIQHLGKDSLGKIVGPKVLVTASKVETQPPSLVLFRSYAPRVAPSVYMAEGFLMPERTLTWKAARCSSAAPIYFASSNGMADGALCTNNPCSVLISDFCRVKKIETEHGIDNKESIHLVVSLGTGTDPKVTAAAGHCDVTLSSYKPAALLDTLKKSSNLIQMFVMQCLTSDGTVVEYSREWCHALDIPFFRIQPLLEKKVPLDEKRNDQLLDLLWQTEIFLRTQCPHQIDAIVRLMRAIHTKRGLNNTLNPAAENDCDKTAMSERSEKEIP